MIEAIAILVMGITIVVLVGYERKTARRYKMALRYNAELEAMCHKQIASILSIRKERNLWRAEWKKAGGSAAALPTELTKCLRARWAEHAPWIKDVD